MTTTDRPDLTDAALGVREIKPCPFCGRDASVLAPAGQRTWWTVRCRGPACPVAPDAVGVSPTEAIERWNRCAAAVRAERIGAIDLDQAEKIAIGIINGPVSKVSDTVVRVEARHLARAFLSLIAFARCLQKERGAIVEGCALVCDARSAAQHGRPDAWDASTEAAMCAQAIRHAGEFPSVLIQRPRPAADCAGICSRCKNPIDGFQPPTSGSMTIGYYVAEAWPKYADPGDVYICDACMWADLRYVADYGAQRVRMPKSGCEEAAR